jgi:hypothetical protein
MTTKEPVPSEVIVPQGRYIIELRDERTGKVQQIVKSNYITPLWANFAKWWQTMPPSFMHKMVHNSAINAGNSGWTGVGQAFANRSVYPFWPRPFPWQCIVLTDDTTPENTAHHWMKGTPTGWASMWKSNNVPASGRRGQINEGECTVSSNGQVQKKVFDWLTTQANGTYQTIGIGLILGPNTLDCLATSHGPHAIVMPSLTELRAAIAAGPIGNSTNFDNIADITISNGKVFAKVSALTFGTNANLSRVLVADLPGGLWATDLDGSGVHYDLSGLTWTDVTTGMTNWTDSSSSNTSALYFQWRREIIYDATDNDIAWAEIWGASFPQGRLGRNDLTSKAAVWTRTWQTDYARANNTPTTYMGLAKIGSFLYISVPSSGTSGGPSGEVWQNQLYRVNWSDGLGLTLVPFPTGFYSIGGLTTDGTDLIAWTNRGIVRMTTAGAITANYGCPLLHVGAVGEYSLSPWESNTGSTFQQQLFKGDGHGHHMWPFGNLNEIQNPERSNQMTINLPNFQTTGGIANTGASENTRHLRYANGKLWLPCPSSENAGAGIGASRNIMPGITGANAFSRALLDAPVTKSSTQTMKVSYELTFPDMDLWVHDHPGI